MSTPSQSQASMRGFGAVVLAVLLVLLAGVWLAIRVGAAGRIHADFRALEREFLHRSAPKIPFPDPHRHAAEAGKAGPTQPAAKPEQTP